MRTRSGRVETLWTTISRCTCQPAKRALPSASVVGSAATSDADAAPTESRARAFARDGFAGQCRRRPDERAAQLGRAERRARLCEHGRRAGDRSGRRARAVDRSVARGPVARGAGLRGRDRDSRRDDVGLHAPVVRKPGRRERCDRRDSVVGGVGRVADRDARRGAARDAGEQLRRVRRAESTRRGPRCPRRAGSLPAAGVRRRGEQPSRRPAPRSPPRRQGRSPRESAPLGRRRGSARCGRRRTAATRTRLASG